MLDMPKGDPVGIRRKPDRSHACNKQTLRVIPLDACGRMTARVYVVECVLVKVKLIHRRHKVDGVFQIGWLMVNG